MKRRLYAVAYLLLLALLLAGYGFLENTESGHKITTTIWGLNVRHHSEVLAQMSRIDQQAVEQKARSDGAAGDVSVPVLTPASGVYPRGLVVTVRGVQPDHVLRYSLDGSIPTARHPQLEGDLEISATTAVRARAFTRDGSAASDTVTASYVVNDLRRTPSLHLVMDPVYLHDKHAGIYANPQQKGRAWERPAMLFVAGAETAEIQDEVTVRIHGAASRSADKKNFRIYLKQSGPEIVDWFVAREGVSPTQREWVLKRADNNSQLYSDRFITRVSKQMGLPVGAADPCLLYLNGELLGAYDLMERMNSKFLQGKEGADTDYVLLHGMPLDSPPDPASPDWRDLRKFIATADLASDEAFGYVSSRIDVDNFVDYFALSIFMADSDRPHWNIDLFRPRTPDGKWKFAVWDFDGGLNYLGLFTHHDTMAWHLRDRVRPDLKPVGSPDNPDLVQSTVVFRKLMANDAFRARFKNRLQELLATDLSSSNLANTLETMLNDYTEVVPVERQRFDGDPPSDARRAASYEERLARIVDFIQHRPEVVRGFLSEL